MKKNISLLLVMFLSFGVANMQAGTINTNDAIGTLPGIFNVNTNGAATYYIPIKLPKGRGGMTPSLGLSYNSQTKNGIIGMGWSLSGISVVSRAGENLYNDNNITQVNYDNNDKFILDGQRLIQIYSNSTYTAYRTEEDSFSKIFAYGSDSHHPTYFQVFTKSGKIIEYGRDEDNNNSSFVPSGTSDKLLWRVNKIEDRKLNYINYYYSTDGDPEEITKITYAGNSQTGDGPSYEIDFSYSNRNDPNTYYVSGTNFSQSHLLSSITVKYHGQTVKSYQITYDQSALYPRLVNISTTDINGNTMNPTVFSYDAAQSSFSELSVPTNQSGKDVKYTLGDFNGDGTTDIACTYYIMYNGSPVYTGWSVFYSNGDGTFTQGPEKSLPTDFVKFVSGDFNGDGKGDLVKVTQSENVYYLSTGNSFNDSIIGQGSFYANEGSNPVDFRAVDLNGDGKDELMITSLQNGNGFVTDYALSGTSDTRMISYGFSYPTGDINPVGTGKFTGDGKTDLLINTQSNESILLEYNNVSKNLEEVNSSGYTFPTADPGNYIGDFNGDGNDDILSPGSGQWTVMYFDGKNGWVTGPSIPNPQPTEVFHTYRDFHVSLSDFNGDGKTDVLYTYKEYYFDPHNLGSSSQFVAMHWDVYYSTGTGFKENSFTSQNETRELYTLGSLFCDSNGDGKSECLLGTGSDGLSLILAFFNKAKSPYLIKQISNGLGENINITYREQDDPNFSTGTYNAQYPLFNYHGPLLLVSKTQTDNGLGGSFERDYQYGAYVGNKLGIAPPGFLGNTVTDYSSNTITHTYYTIINNNGYYYIKYPSTILQYGLTSQGWENTLDEIKKVTNTVAIKNTVPGNHYIYYPVVIQSITKSWDNGSPDTFIGMKTVTQPIDSIDNWGNSLEHSVIVSKDEQGTVYASTTYESAYTQNQDTVNWIIGRPDYTVVTNHYANDSKDNSVRTNYTYYPNGNQSWPLVSNIEVIPNNDTKYRTETALQYDSYGHVTKKTVSTPDLSVASNPPLISRVTDYAYDETTYSSRFLTSETQYNGSTSFTSTFQYNLPDGTLSKSTNADGLATSYEYGPFDQMIKVINPDGSSTTTQLQWASASSVSSLAPQNAAYALSTKKPDHSQQIVFYDKLGRTVRKMITGLTNTQWIGIDKVYDDRGFLKMVSQPYFSTSPPSQGDATQWTTYTRNSLNNKITSVASPTNTVTFAQTGLQFSFTNSATGVTRTVIKDPLGRNISVTDPTGTINYEYYSNGALKSADAAGNTTTITYDDAGRKQKIVNPNSGTTQYSYSNFGQLLSQTDSKGNNYKMTYDELGRIKNKTLTNTAALTTYTYNDVSGTNGFGALKSVVGPDNVTYQYTYNNLAQLTEKSETIDGSTYNSQFTYDSIGELNKQTYPSGYAVQYVYSNSGALNQVKDMGSGKVLWTANTINRRGQLTSFTLGNGLTTTKHFNDVSGLPESIITQNGQGTKVQDLTYSFDNGTGNLLSRADVLHNLTENFGYDNVLHSRLTSWQVTGQTAYSATLTNNGNILTKSDITASGGKYLYGSAANKPNAVEKVTQPTTDFEQNAFQQNIAYTAFNKIDTIQQVNTGTQTHTYNYTLEYGPDFARKKSVLTKDGVIQDVKYYIGGNYETETGAAGHERKMNYLYGGDGLFAIYVQNNGADTMYYIQKNYLGSYYCVTNTSGNIVTMDGQQQVYSFDPWGRRRNATTWTYTNVLQNFLFDRGFTGQEHLDVFGLINLNGRAYDPRLGRMLSPDPEIQDMSSTQSYNSYTYANNNPLKYVDPSGYNAAVAVITMPNDNPFSDETVSSSGGGGGSSYGDYTYDWSTGVYLDRYGNLVGWNDVNNNYVLPNASKTYNFNSISAVPMASVNLSFSALLSGQIGYAYFEPGSSYTSSNGQHVGFGVVDAMASGGENQATNISDAGVNFILHFEGVFFSRVKPDAVGRPTIGYGHLIKRGETFSTITKVQALALFKKDLAFTVNVVNKDVMITLNQNEFDALTSFVYNVGAGNFSRSTLLRDVNAENIEGIEDSFLMWNKGTINGVLTPIPGLTSRRQAEAELYLYGIY